MTELEKHILQFVLENWVGTYLNASGHYRKRRAAEEQWQVLRQSLTPAQASLLDTCRELEEDADWNNQQAVFQAALAAGLELGRLPMSAGQ